MSFKEKIGTREFDMLNEIMGKVMEEDISTHEKMFLKSIGNPVA